MKTKSVHQKEYQCYPMEQHDSPNSTTEKGKNYALSSLDRNLEMKHHNYSQ